MSDLLPNVEGDRGQVSQSTPVLVANGLQGSPPVSAASVLNVAAFAETAFSAGTGTQSIATGSRMKAVIKNPLGSGVRIILAFRRFSNDRQGADALLERRFLPAFSGALTAPEIGCISPLNNGSGNSVSLADFRYSVDAQTLTGAVIGAPLPLNGIPETIEALRFIYPGQAIAYEIEGGQGALQDSARAEMTFAWVEESWTAP